MHEVYEKAKRLGDKEYKKLVAEGRYPFLPALDYMVSEIDTYPQINVGLMEIPLSLVIGTKTEGRTNAFARNFMPVLDEKSEFAAKWAALYESQLEEGIRDPVKVFEFLGKFYIQEGNKRVSVMKYVDAPYIMAEITRILPSKKDDPEIVRYYEFLDFFKVAPTYDLDISVEGGYQNFAKLIGLNLEDPWAEDTVKDVKSAVSRFEKIYFAKGGEKLSITSGDAMLIYLHFYRLHTLLNDSDDVISSRISKLWTEFLTAANEDNVELIEKPEAFNEEKGLLDFILYPPTYSKTKPLKAAFMYGTNVEDSSWTYLHELGRNHVNEYFEGGVIAEKYENCGNGKGLADAIDRAVEDGAEIIFTTSSQQMPATLRSAIHYPDVRFLNCSVNLPHNVVRTYYCRIHEAKFVMGALAASEAQDHRIGYRADYPVYGSIAGINAFALGAAMIDPKARIYLEWASQKDNDWKNKFRQKGISVISGADMIRPGDDTGEYGLYHADYEVGDVRHIAVPLWNWGKFYELFFQRFMKGKRLPSEKPANDVGFNYWWGMDSGVVGVVNSVRMSYHTRRLSDFLCESIKEGRLFPFDGEIHAADRIIKEAGDPRLTNEEIVTMDWLCDNIEGYIPEPDELVEYVREAVDVSGVKKGS